MNFTLSGLHKDFVFEVGQTVCFHTYRLLIYTASRTIRDHASFSWSFDSKVLQLEDEILANLVNTLVEIIEQRLKPDQGRMNVPPCAVQSFICLLNLEIWYADALTMAYVTPKTVFYWLTRTVEHGSLRQRVLDYCLRYMELYCPEQLKDKEKLPRLAQINKDWVIRTLTNSNKLHVV